MRAAVDPVALAVYVAQKTPLEDASAEAARKKAGEERRTGRAARLIVATTLVLKAHQTAAQAVIRPQQFALSYRRPHQVLQSQGAQ